MATNDFLVVAPGPAPNVASQATYAADPIVTTGNVSGVAKSAIVNKAWRQSSIMAAVVAQLIVDVTGQNAVDDGTTATLLVNLKAALAGRLIGVQTFSTPGTFTYTPTPGTTKVRIRVQGGGGGGAGCVATAAGQVSLGATGSSGAYCESLLTTGFSGVSVVVGAAGTVASGAGGGNGGVSSFASTPTAMSAPGGPGGGNNLTSGNSTIVGTGTAVATGGNIANNTGLPGGASLAFSATSGNKGFAAPSSYPGYGRGGDGQINVASQPATVGNPAQAGAVIVEEYR